MIKINKKKRKFSNQKIWTTFFFKISCYFHCKITIIVGKEGLLASLAVDYSIKEFKTLSGLLLWWGRIASKNTSMVANFVIHRGLIKSFNQFIFSLLFYYNAVALYNEMLSFGYSTIFISLPSISILLDRVLIEIMYLNFLLFIKFY